MELLRGAVPLRICRLKSGQCRSFCSHSWRTSLHALLGCLTSLVRQQEVAHKLGSASNTEEYSSYCGVEMVENDPCVAIQPAGPKSVR